MSSDSFQSEVLLPEFLSSVSFYKKQNPMMAIPELLDKAFCMTKRGHNRMTSRDKSFLYLHANV